MRRCLSCSAPILRRDPSDSYAARRQYCSLTCRYGSASNVPPNTKLNAPAVVDMRERYAAGTSLEDLAKAYGVSYAAAHRAVTRRSWRRV